MRDLLIDIYRIYNKNITVAVCARGLSEYRALRRINHCIRFPFEVQQGRLVCTKGFSVR